MPETSVLSPAEVEIVLKSAEARYTELGIPAETGDILFTREVAKATAQAAGEQEKKALGFSSPEPPAGANLKAIWGGLPAVLRQGLINALIGGGLGAAGGAGLGALTGCNVRESAITGGGAGALATSLTPLLLKLFGKAGSAAPEELAAIKQAALERMDEFRVPRVEAEKLLNDFVIRTAAAEEEAEYAKLAARLLSPEMALLPGLLSKPPKTAPPKKPKVPKGVKLPKGPKPPEAAKEAAGGLGRMGGPAAGGPGGNCVCPECGATAMHKVGAPCYSRKCPKCGATMTRATAKAKATTKKAAALAGKMSTAIAGLRQITA